MGKKKRRAAATPAIKQLEDTKVTFTTHEYEHSNDDADGYGLEAARKLGYDERQVFKTLMADTGDERVIGESGYVVGGISPLGQKTQHRTVLDESALEFDEILVSGGKRGLSLGVNPHDLLAVLDATTAPIATQKKSY